MILRARRFFLRSTFAAIASASVIPAGAALATRPVPGYANVLRATENMVADGEAQRLAAAHGLNIVNVTWEDTGRYKGSSVGSNISDMSIQVQEKDPATGQLRLHLMPVIRFPNFEDTSGDVPLDRFSVLVGNEDGKGLRRVTLKELLGNIRKYLTVPGSWKGDRTSLLAPRDTHALVSAQAAFLPIPKSGEAQFNPVLFNYQSYEGDPAVLTILATREGTSVTVIDNKRDGFEAGGVWGQRLFFNQNGQRASLTGKRMSDFDEVQTADRVPGEVPTGPSVGKEEGLNMVLLIQVPLKQKHPMQFDMLAEDAEAGPVAAGLGERGRSDVENAVIGHGDLEGPFTEIADLDIERDANYPVRVTVQFYKATSNGAVNATDLAQIKSQIDRVYKDADYVGSLVTQGETGRPTELTGDHHEPLGWWNAFWDRHTKNMGMSEEKIRWLMQTMYSPGWFARPGWWSDERWPD